MHVYTHVRIRLCVNGCMCVRACVCLTSHKLVAELFEISNGQFIEDELRLRDYDFRIGSVSKTRWLISGERDREREREREREG